MKITIPNVLESNYYKRLLLLLNGDAQFTPRQIEVLSVVLEIFEGIYKEAEKVPISLVKHLKREIRDTVRENIEIKSSFLSTVLEILKSKGVFDDDFVISEYYKRLVKGRLNGDTSISFVIKTIPDLVIPDEIPEDVTVSQEEDEHSS